MNIIEQIQHRFAVFLQDTFDIDKKLSTEGTFTLNVDPHKQQFGDLNANAPLILSKIVKRNPREIAQEIAHTFSHDYIQKLEIAGPGFLNATLTKAALHTITQQIFEQQTLFFKTDHAKSDRYYSIEFVSANPTGPLHLGHGRGAIIGDVLGDVLRFLGYQAIKEFYINDAGSQIQKLGISFKIRCQQAAGIEVALPEDAYHGNYLAELAQQCVATYKDNLNLLWHKSDNFFAHYAKEYLLRMIKGTLQDYGVQFDIWFSEQTLHDSGAIEKAILFLKEHGYIYEKDGAQWFKATDFGDDKDRVIRKKSGELTYVAADIAYMRNKIEQGSNYLIMVLGHDHHSYVTRLECVRRALGLDSIPLNVILYQLVKMKEGGKLVQMSKRTGTMITLREVIDAVGRDVARFFYLHRKADAQLEFDLDLALKKTEENPVYYVQYAYVRINSILTKAAEHPEMDNITIVDVADLGNDEKLLIKKIVSLKELLEAISSNYQIHLLTYYIIELADLFHHYYAHHRVIDLENIALSRSRMLLLYLLKDAFITVLDLLGISKPDKM